MKYFALFFVGAILSLQGTCQGMLPGSYIGLPMTGANYRPMPMDTMTNKKWSLSKYGGISTGISVFKGGSATFIAAPIGLQLNRKITNNLYAFAGVNVAPSYVNVRQNFLNSSNGNKSFQSNSFMYQPNGLTMQSRAEIGLMYTNDERTFQISGSIGVERRQVPQLRDFQILDQSKTRPLLYQK